MMSKMTLVTKNNTAKNSEMQRPSTDLLVPDDFIVRAQSEQQIVAEENEELMTKQKDVKHKIPNNSIENIKSNFYSIHKELYDYTNDKEAFKEYKKIMEKSKFVELPRRNEILEEFFTDEQLNPKIEENEGVAIQKLIDKYEQSEQISKDPTKVDRDKLKELINLADKTKSQLDRIKECYYKSLESTSISNCFIN